MQVAPTIFAVSSGSGRAGVAVIRISGPAAGAVLTAMAPPLPPPRYAALRRLRHPKTAEVLDEALVLWMPGPRSETGEDMAELHVHGGAAVIRAVLEAVSRVTTCRLAEPGEFARRAFENGKIDLTAAEGLADLVDAETDAQRRLALRQAGGALASLYEQWRMTLLEARALAEAAIDFSDEGDVASNAMSQAAERVTALLPEIARHLDDGHRGEIIRSGFRVVLAGPPNAGKSSLLNALARRDVAIVSAEPGTTRDVLEVHLDLAGHAVILTDTAGLREASGPIEQEGIRRALGKAREADLVIWLVDAASPVWTPPPEIAAGRCPVLTVANKADLTRGGAPGGMARKVPPADLTEPVSISALTGEGLTTLTDRLAAEVTSRLNVGAAPVLTQERHRLALTACHAALERILSDPDQAPELLAEDLRLAADALGRLTGRVDVEDLLGQIFGRFCIGK